MSDEKPELPAPLDPLPDTREDAETWVGPGIARDPVEAGIQAAHATTGSPETREVPLDILNMIVDALQAGDASALRAAAQELADFLETPASGIIEKVVMSSKSDSRHGGEQFHFRFFQLRDRNGKVIPPEVRQHFQVRGPEVHVNASKVEVQVVHESERGKVDCDYYVVIPGDRQAAGVIVVDTAAREGEGFPWVQAKKIDGTTTWTFPAGR